jgi:quercetin dioxygenase-like cupin family protein
MTTHELDEELLSVQPISALDRRDEALVGSGVAAQELSATKGALTALAAVGADPAPGPGRSALRERLMASVNRGGKFGIFADRLARMFDLDTDAAAELAKRAEDPTAWMPFFVPGIEMIPVTTGPKVANGTGTLVRIQPGTTFPEHAHRGEETMFVMEGGFRETNGPGEAWRGDELIKGDGSEHAIVALPGVPCVAAAIVTGLAEFK